LEIHDYASVLYHHECAEYKKDKKDGIESIKATLDGKFLMVGFRQCIKFFRVEVEENVRLHDIRTINVSSNFIEVYSIKNK
jgi:hypothetical protein